MKRLTFAILAGVVLLCGCGENSPPAQFGNGSQTLVVVPGPDRASPRASSSSPASPRTPATPTATPSSGGAGMDEVIAKVNGEPMTMRQLVDPLIASHGLTMLVNLVELELAKQNADKYHAIVTQKDFDDERDRTLEKMFKDSDDPKLTDALDKAVSKKDAVEEAHLRTELKAEREDFLTQFLVNQHIDSVEFEIVLKINTYLRKILEFDWKDKIQEADVRAAFGQMYGERVRVEYIDMVNMNEVIQAQRRLQNGDPFEQVAKDMSHDRLTAPLGGALPPFSREAPEKKIPANFRDMAFSLRDGQVSDTVTVGSSFMLIKRLEISAPQAVKYADVHDTVFRTLHDKLMDAGLKALKQQLAVEARSEMKIENPVLSRQFQENVDRQVRADKKAKEELDRQEHLRQRVTGATQPADSRTAPPAGAATQANDAAAGERPPATQPEGHAFSLPRLGPDTLPSVLPDANK